MSIAIALAMAACVVGFPAILGVWSVWLWQGKLDKDAEIANPTGIAVGISLVIAASIIAVLAPEAQQEVGPWIRYLGAYAAVTFAVGLLIGWAENRNGKQKSR